jgi:hypothetical protein
VAGPAASRPDCTQNPAALTLASVILTKDPGLFSGQERWDLPCSNGNASSGAPPGGGANDTFSLTRASDSVVVHQNYPLNGTTRDVGDIMQINATDRATFLAGHTVASLAGTTLTITVVSPTTFPVLFSFITGFCQNATEVVSGGGTDVQGAVGNIPNGVTAGTIALPAQCNGAAPAAINVGVWSVGLNGERTLVSQNFHH